MTTLAGFILVFSILSGTNSHILAPKRYDEHPVIILGESPPPPGVIRHFPSSDGKMANFCAYACKPPWTLSSFARYMSVRMQVILHSLFARQGSTSMKDARAQSMNWVRLKFSSTGFDLLYARFYTCRGKIRSHADRRMHLKILRTVSAGDSYLLTVSPEVVDITRILQDGRIFTRNSYCVGSVKYCGPLSWPSKIALMSFP